jgi:L-ascorbate metabolism protein UlaG (beta-lactamase superfamily)
MKIKTISTTILICLAILINSIPGNAQKTFQTDKIKASKGDIEITFIGHGSLMFKYDGKIIQIDPFSHLADYSSFPKADLILITHSHFDHLDSSAIQKIKIEKTKLIITQKCKEVVGGLGNSIIMKNGDTKEIDGIKIKAVPAYNIVNRNKNGAVFHPKGEGNGYVLTIGGKNIYIAGDTENIPEMKQLKNIDVAFLPMNLPYTMTPEMVADAAKMFKPKILYPYHFGETDTSKILELLKNEKGIEVRIREMK